MIVRAFSLALAICPVAHGAAVHADQRSGTLQFSAVQAGARFSGGFGTFDVRLDFDPARTAGNSLHVTVDTASIDTQDADRDEILKSRDFFWIDRHPQAVFHAERFERDGAGWRALGELAIRGARKPVAVRFTLAPEGDAPVMKGSASLRRLDFGLGQGDWASTEWIGNEVDVRFELELNPARASSG